MTTFKTTVTAIVALLLPAAACGPPAAVLPHEDSAAGHRRRAGTEQQKAAAYPSHSSPKADLYYGARRDERLRLAYAHDGAAQALEDEYNEQCVERGFSSLPVWPAVAEVRESQRGVTLLLAEDPAASMDDAVAQLRCRRAAMARDGFTKFPHDPLALPGVELAAGADTGTIVLTVATGGSQVSDLRKRAGTVARR